MSEQAPFSENEFERALKLSDYDIDYSEIHAKMDDLTRLAAHVAGTPISLINLLDLQTQWTASSYGIDLKQMPREDSVCQYTILKDEPMEIKDLNKDDRFKNKEYVTEEPNLKYYFGLPITSPDGYKIGSVCVMNDDDHELSPEKVDLLKIIANEVITQLEYEQKLKLMQNNMDSLSEISRKVSHDIRGPISGIIGLSEILKNQAEEDKLSDLIELIELINKGGRSVLDLADEILSNYKESSDGIEFPQHSFNLPLMQEKLKDLYGPSAKAKSIDYSVEINEENKHITFPKHKLLQIVGNLISNAIKFTPENGSVKVWLELVLKQKRQLVVRVRDTGIGMSDEQIRNITDRTSSTTTAGTRQERGYGFGLQLATHLLESTNGEFSIDSESGKGTTISVSIPVKS